MAFTRKTELRHISPAQLTKIAEILNQTHSNPAWKKLMQSVPSKFTDPEHLSEGGAKYSYNDIKTIENAAAKNNKPGSQIFLEEWSTSGQIRPSLGHLLQLLIKSEIFRAADYVAVDLLNEAPPQRPSKGPAAKIDIALTDDIDEILNGNYPNSSEIMNLDKGHTQNKATYNKGITIGDAPMSELDLIKIQESNNNNTAATIPQSVASKNDLVTTPENFSNHSVPEAFIPNFSNIMTNELSSPLNNQTDGQVISPAQSTASEVNYSHQQSSESELSSELSPDLSLLNIQSPIANHLSQTNLPSEPPNLPNISMLNIESDSSNYLKSQDAEEIPFFSLINQSNVATEDSMDRQESSANLPQLSALNN